MSNEIDLLKKYLAQSLPGVEFQFKMARVDRSMIVPSQEIYHTLNKAAVAVIFFYENDNLKLIMIQRPHYDGAHSGQMAFPGGRCEKEDSSWEDTAIRETWEEVGIRLTLDNIIGRLTEVYVPISKFIVQPIVTFLSAPPKVYPDPFEVENVYFFNFYDFLNSANIQNYEYFYKGAKYTTPSFVVNNKTIWGASAMIICELIEVYRRITI